MSKSIRRAFTLPTLALACFAIGAPSAHATGTRVACMEDQPCFVWSTMGNVERGVYVYGRHARVIVSPRRFRALTFAGRIDWHRTEHLRGDWTALAHGGCI